MRIKTYYTNLFKSLSNYDTLVYCREMVNGVPTKTGTRGSGVADTDFLVVVDAVQVSACGTGLLAFATTCQIDNQLNRYDDHPPGQLYPIGSSSYLF
ncbi:unnamed protein product [Echinostoma caproni]|uniref:Uncharacterized protein n=1 Tax=Echinostoma caproni TaxID=27848 RepID=A0A3P8I7B5_9TREM|nr:unnamed protein product [Echinostoma caproni]